MSNHAHATSSGSKVGIVVGLIAIAMLFAMISYAIGGPVILAPIVPDPIPAPAATMPVAIPSGTCCYPEKKLLTNSVEGYKVPVRCIGNIEVGGFSVQSTDDPQSQAANTWLTLELAKTRSQNYNDALCRADKWNTQPKVVHTHTERIIPVHVAPPSFVFDRWYSYDTVVVRGLYYRYYGGSWGRYYP